MNKIIITFLKLLIAFCLLGYLIYHAQINFSLLTQLLHTPVTIVCILILFISIIFINAYRWHKLNQSQAIYIPFRQCFLATYVGTAFNNVLPGAIGGDFVRLLYLFRKSPEQKTEAVVTIFLDRFTGLISIFFLISAVSMFNLTTIDHDTSLHYLLIICLLVSGTGILSFFALTFMPTAKLSDFFKTYFPKISSYKSVAKLAKAIRIYQHKKFLLLECLLASFLIQGVNVLILCLLVKVFAFPTFNFIHYTLAISITQIVNLIPIAPGGLGLGEMAFAKVLILLSGSGVLAFATIFFSFRLLTIIAYVPGIIIAMLAQPILPSAQVQRAG